MSTINPIASIGDVIRGSLLADRLEQIPLLLESITERVTEQGGKFYIKNFWNDPKPLSLGYVGVHIKILMPVPSKKTNAMRHNQTGFDKQKRKYILMELQLHIKEIMDGTKGCAKEIAHLLYKAPEEAEEKISADVISSSQLVYLTAMTKLLAPKEKLKKVEAALNIIQSMTKADKKKRLFMETAMLLCNEQLQGDWNEQLQVIVPKNKQAIKAVEDEWMRTAGEINKLLKLPIVKMDERDVWANSATSLDELYANAAKIAPFFREMCTEAAASLPKCSVNFGPKEAHMIKEKKSLLNKMKKYKNSQMISESDSKEEGDLKLKKVNKLLKKAGSLFQITDLENLATLTSLDLANSKITDSSLAYLGSLFSATLHRLNLSKCTEITGSGLACLVSLVPGLKTLDLSECCNITDSDLASLAGFTAMESLKLQGCEITHKGMANLEDFTGLQSLDLSSCKWITDRGLFRLRGLTSLREISLQECDKITDTGLAILGVLTALQSLNLQGCNHINGSGLDDLNGLTDLKILNLSNCRITDSGMPDLGSLTELQSLDLSGSPLTDAGLVSLAGLTKLKILNLSGCKGITHAGLAHLGKLIELKTLNLRGCNGIAGNLTSLRNLTELEILDLSHCSINDDAMVVLGGFTKLHSLSLRGCNRIVGNLAGLGNLTKLQSLDLSGCPINDANLVIIKGLTKLHSLDLSSCKWITDRGLDNLAGLSALQNLSLADCIRFTDRGLAGLGRLSMLKSLDLYGCFQITGNGLAGLDTLIALESLNLGGCYQITDSDLINLRSLTELKKLNLQGCKHITKKCLDSLGHLVEGHQVRLKKAS